MVKIIIMGRKNSYLRTYLDKRVFTRLRVVIIFAAVFIVASIFEVAVYGFNVLYALGSIILGLLVGIIVCRIYQLSWDSETHQVVSNMDWIGVVILAFYIIFMVGRSIIVGYWVHGSTYFGIIFSITAGVMIGRLIGTRHTLIKIREDLRKFRESIR